MSATTHVPRSNEHRLPDIAVHPPGAWPPDPQAPPTVTGEGFHAYTPSADTQYCDHKHSIDEETEIDAAPCPRHVGKQRHPVLRGS